MARVQGVIQKAMLLVIGLGTTQAFGQGLNHGAVSSIFNSALASSLPRASTVPISQSVSQIADGGGFKTTIILANTDIVPANFTLNFWHADGSPLSLPLLSQGSQQQVTGTIPVNGSVTFETPGGLGTFSQGWGQLVTTNSIGGTVIFRQSVPGTAPSEAAVPVTMPTSTVLVLPYDETTGFDTALALVNTDPNNAAVVTANLYDQSGNLLTSGPINLPPQGQQVIGSVQSTFPQAAGLRGSVSFSSSAGPITGFGLRFSPGGTFTSLPVLTPGQ
ncbi:MAG TPA: hypothetical protein VG096_23695 [Bryobacteraceae bacterium]|jgi:hypothetical protein|nr:hypothetical protein [Bryobacteraceae bacterium]